MEEERRSKFQRICVFCGSSSGRKASYQDAAVALGKKLVERRIDLVYGGGSVGLMGLLSQVVHSGGRHVLGIIPRTLMPIEIIGGTVGEVRAVSDMHQRKAEMARLADAFIALPGGYGTLEELLEVITWVELGIHHKPVGLLNVEGYYNSLLCFLDKAVEKGFISPTTRRIIVSAPTAKQLVRELEVERRIDLVYGGGSVGLMGLLSQVVHSGGRHVLVIIPRTLIPIEIIGGTVGEVRAVFDMHQRKAEMARLADAFIALPGGYGTLEELLEVITWAELGIHHKPVGLLNVEGYYNSLLCFLDKAVEEGFISPTARRIIVSAPTAKQLVRELEDIYFRNYRIGVTMGNFHQDTCKAQCG